MYRYIDTTVHMSHGLDRGLQVDCIQYDGASTVVPVPVPDWQCMGLADSIQVQPHHTFCQPATQVRNGSGRHNLTASPPHHDSRTKRNQPNTCGRQPRKQPASGAARQAERTATLRTGVRIKFRRTHQASEPSVSRLK